MTSPLRTISRMGIAALITALLVACSGGTGQNQSQVAALIQIREVIKTNREIKNAKPREVTREVIDQIGQTLVEVEVPRRDLTGYFFLDSVRGPVQVWVDSSGAHLVLREGLVTGTRGVGDDLKSSSYASTLEAIKRGSGTSRRQYFVANGLGQQDQINATCTYSMLGAETLSIYGLTHATRKVRESCRTDSGQEFQNTYWIETSSGLVRQSSQWISPQIGHFDLRILNTSQS